MKSQEYEAARIMNIGLTPARIGQLVWETLCDCRGECSDLSNFRWTFKRTYLRVSSRLTRV